MRHLLGDYGDIFEVELLDARLLRLGQLAPKGVEIA